VSGRTGRLDAFLDHPRLTEIRTWLSLVAACGFGPWHRFYPAEKAVEDGGDYGIPEAWV